jgi:hypothetical protein
MPTPPPTRDDRGLNAGEKREIRQDVLTFVPAVLVAFVLRWVLVANAGWTSRRAMLVSIGVGIVLALLLQRALRGRGGS